MARPPTTLTDVPRCLLCSVPTTSNRHRPPSVFSTCIVPRLVAIPHVPSFVEGCSNTTTTTTARHRLPRPSAFDIYPVYRQNRIHGALHTHPRHPYAISDRIGVQEGTWIWVNGRENEIA
ncbi:hypothetical protein SCHPADRAFT_911760 [Schizopora paradoxa]|uniref:Uncharacterized protein n=1 Tax=Schizopora paradoxa TaxID=27342 RepID=A0A0H2R3Y2_9AGAM|nr:hypothetical protein SCHPADRAFT_911760 [Schizopora paradoxa]